jgi:kinetochore protein Spc7/SPC105
MKDDISFGQAALAATEEVCDLDNPPVIREYLSASDEDKQLFEMTFKAFKTNTQLKARAGWYDWKMSLMGRVRPDVEEMLEGMREVNRVPKRGFVC